MSARWSLLTWTNKLLFSDSFLRGSARGSENKEDRVGLRKSYKDVSLCQASLLRSTTSYIKFVRGKWDMVSGKISYSGMKSARSRSSHVA